LHFSGRNCCGFDDPHTQCHLLPVRVVRRWFISLLGCQCLQKAWASGLRELQLYLTLDEDFFCCTVSLAGFMPWVEHAVLSVINSQRGFIIHYMWAKHEDSKFRSWISLWLSTIEVYVWVYYLWTLAETFDGCCRLWCSSKQQMWTSMTMFSICKWLEYLN
jgi:hypothetical protein